MTRKVTIELSDGSVDLCKTRIKQLELPYSSLEDYVAYLVLKDSSEAQILDDNLGDR